MTDPAQKRRWINLGEVIAILALVVSAAGVWISWKTSDDGKGPTEVVEHRQPVPLTLRSKREDDGRRLEISPAEDAHTLQSLRITIAGASPIEVGSDGELSAGDVETALRAANQERAGGTQKVPVQVAARYVEAGAEKTASRRYTLRYQWKGGGLFGGRSLHLVSLSR